MRRIRFDVPRWHVYLHREARELERVEKDDPPHRQLEDELFDRLYSGGGEELPENERNEELAAWAEKLHDTCSQLPTFERLSQECIGDADAAATAVETLMDELASVMKEKPESIDNAVIRKALGNGCHKASGVIERQREAKNALDQVSFIQPGRGSQKGTVLSSPSARKLAARLKNDERLMRIALLAGKFKQIAARKQRAKVHHGADEVTDLELGNDLARVLPVELASLLHPRRKLALMRDLIEQRALQYRLESTESLGKGPLVVCLDKSGSMSGPSDIWATAVALALLDVAQRQRRHFALLCFDAQVKHEVIVMPGDSLPEDALFVSCVGGTAIDRVLSRGLEIIQKHEGQLKKADLVLITDGQSETYNAPNIRRIAAGLGVTILGFGIGVDEHELAPWTDEAQSVKRLDNVDDTVAGKIFSL